MLAMPGTDKIIDETQPEYIRMQNDPVFPCRFDGRPSRYHPQDVDSWEFKSHDKYMAQVWQSEQNWTVYQKSDFVNRYNTFKQIVDGKVVENDPNIFVAQHNDDIVKSRRITPS
jgi:hypothetical protein